jgi:Type ISP C-terminal specificity domain
VFDVLAALFSAPSYTRRFAADLEDAFPHVPFPTDLDVFRQAVEVGERIRRLQTFDLQPEQRFWTARLEGSPKDRTLAVLRTGSGFLDQGNGFGTIRLNPTLRLERVPLRVWEFAVSGYRVVYRWLDARNGLSLDEVIDEETGDTLQRQVLDLVARVAAYLAACDAAEPVLEAALASSLTKNDLKYGQAALL